MGRKLFALLVAGLFFYTASPLILPVLMGAILGVLFLPLLERAEKHRVPTGLGAFALTVLICILVIVPIAGLIFFGAKSGFQQLQIFRHGAAEANGNVSGGDWIDALIDTPRFKSALVWLSHYFPATVTSLSDSTHDLIQTVMAKITEWLGLFIAALPGLLLALAVTTVSLFFFLVDGRHLVTYFRRNSLFTQTQTDELIQTLAGMCRSVILASVVCGLVQAMLMLLACLILGLPNAALLSALVFLLSFIPVVGALPITAGAVLHEFFTADTTHGVVMLVMVMLIVVVDSLVRPVFLKGSTNLHPLLAFVAAFGGLQMFGFMGVFLGPIIAGLFVATVQLLKEDAGTA